ncbi:hypothetical protein KHA80_01420 [Anaerobacillus sp. HL2]|nr:hypothetical protein KHA80_01420 [Anaerobacillus sp. HL2]
MILQRFYDGRYFYTGLAVAPNFNEIKEHDACLLIGDDAILTVWNLPSDIHRYDLGQLYLNIQNYQ